MEKYKLSSVIIPLQLNESGLNFISRFSHATTLQKREIKNLDTYEKKLLASDQSNKTHKEPTTYENSRPSRSCPTS